MLEDFLMRLAANYTAVTSAGENMFATKKAKPVNQEKREQFHQTIAKGIFL